MLARLLRCAAAATLAVALGLGPAAQAQQATLDVTFRFIPDLTQPPIAPVVRAFLPGSFNDWGPNTQGRIAVGAPSQMTFVEALGEYRYTHRLEVGRTYTYKIHVHRNASGSEWTWLSDPLNPIVTGPFSDSVLEVRDPMVFQPAREEDAQGRTYAVSASLFGTAPFTRITYRVNDGPEQDGLPHFDPATGLFRVVLPEPLPSPVYLRVEGTDAQGRTATAEVGLVPPVVEDRPRPAGLRDGITYVDDTTVRFSLFAPGKRFVHLIGEFNDWEVSQATALYRDRVSDDEVWWWTEVTGLTPGREYAFQYLVDGTLRIVDPYVEKILDPVHDPFIPPTTYPNLKPYPTGRTTGVVGIVHPGRTPYAWQTTDYVRPAYEDLVVYELLVRDFTAARSFQAVADSLDYLQRLGVNAIKLMPVAEFGGNLNWGYQPTFHLAVDKYYGPADALRALVDAAHARGMAVILDVVYNHADSPSPLVDLYGCTEGAPYTNNPARHPFNVFCDLNHESAATQRWLDQANRYWLEEFRIDGFRFDLSKGFTQRRTTSVAAWSAYDASRVALLQRMADRIWEVDPQAYVILEHFAENREEVELALYGRDRGHPGMLLWNNLNRAYSEAAMGWLNAASDFRASYPPHRGGGMPVTGLITYMESHDEQWMMLKNRRFGNRSPDGSYDVRNLLTALHRQKLAGTFFFTIPGPRMLWQFGELGYGGGSGECLKPGDGSHGDCAPSEPGRTDVKPLPWPRGYHTQPDRVRLFQTWAALIRLRRSHPVFTSPETRVEMRVGQGVAGRRIGLELDSVQVVVIGNFGVTPVDVDPAFHRTGTWYEFFSDEALEVTDPNAPIRLEPGEARLYSTIDFPSPPRGIFLVDAEPPAPGPRPFRLDGPFPNPAAAVTTLGFTLPETADVRIEVFDVLGRRVLLAHDAPLAAGAHAVPLPVDRLPNGPYLVRLTAGPHVATTRLTVTR